MKSTFRIFLFLLPILGSCENQKLESEAVATNQNSALTASSNKPILTGTKRHSGAIQLFWKDFRKCILSSDSNCYHKFVKYPLTGRGFLDEDPVIKIKQDKFHTLFRKYYLPKVVSDGDTGMTTNFQLIENTPEYNGSEIGNPEWHRLDDMIFNKTNEGWN